MPLNLREIGALLIRASGIPLFVRHVYARRKATIVLYHDPAPETVDAHLAWLARRYNFISLADLVEAIGTRDWDRLPTRSLVVTFDDGHARNARLEEVFRKHGVRPTIYVCSQIVGTRRRFWFSVTKQADSLKRIPNRDRLRELEQAHGFAETREYPDGAPEALSLEEVQRLAAWADVGSHTRFHPILTTCDDREAEMEIADSRTEIEATIGARCLDFAFPNGDYAERELDLVKRGGYRSARTVDVGWNDVDTNPFRLRITGTSDNASTNLLAAQLSGVTMFIRYRLAGSRWGESPKIRLAGA